MTTNGPPPLSNIPAAALLDALTGGAIVCDFGARVLGANAGAWRILTGDGVPLRSLHALFTQPAALQQALRRAVQTGEPVGLHLATRRGGAPVHVVIRMLDAISDEANRLFLLRVGHQPAPQREIESLHQMLDRTNQEKQALREERDELRNVVDSTIPRLRVLSYEDALTGLGNRRLFDHWLEKEWARSVDQNVPVSVLYIDVDHFKSYNDAYGHGRGDETLAMIAKVLARNAARDVDRVCRLGGEEFAYLLPATDLRGAFNVADRARRGVEALGLPHPQEDFVSISIGVGTIRPTAGDRAKQFLERVDAALYRAKRMGRNRVEFVSDEDGTIRTG